ncbi:pterin-4-alpha-carbinolamine dehydratase [Candidatus Nomurabacteria bacterium RIFCSPHIGHO2_02_FULL_35_13]|uniref:Putative pterin-4-alpha-carbinolamine dehydratase n=1 Tax=Candidatus Nomurabacteria bacterium RIFCSPHIGHO2_02_FULL_35_13 TaxID=1801748 RepID=A0A1F6VQ58_9BACT|nr:MAG: pterin-4-alpha-carbinolamine dehydratase [Candidatus Nomurabacteria bacterium RIFCSPHIGHO2_02_FULL_35_13]
MSDLLNKKCVPCKGGVKPLSRADAQDYTDEVSGWILDEKALKISKEFKFKDFVEAVDFVGRVADVAEEEGHHPDIHIFYNKVLLELSTHSIGGLSENDFILAAKINEHK